MTRKVAALVAVLAFGGLLPACGSGSNQAQTTTVTTTAKATPPPSAGSATSADAERTVRAYYRLVDAGLFDAAWSKFSPELQSTLGGFDQWKAGYDNTVSTRLLSIGTTSVAPGQAQVQVDLVGVANDACGNNVKQTFAGTWTLQKVGGAFKGTGLNVSKTGGPDLVTNPADCQPTPTAPQSSPAPSSPACDPNYSGACLDPNASDYDCAGGSGDGPKYTGPVQVVGTDHYDLDSDGDGSACES